MIASVGQVGRTLPGRRRATRWSLVLGASALIGLGGCLGQPEQPPASDQPTTTTPHGDKPDRTATPSDADRLDATASAPLGRLQPLDRERAAAGWVRLFDGETDFGWIASDAAAVTVAEGALTLAGDGATIETFSRWQDFELLLRYQVQGDGVATLALNRGPNGATAEPIAIPMTPSASDSTLNGATVLTLTVAGTDARWTDPGSGETQTATVADQAGRITIKQTGPGTLRLLTAEVRPRGLASLLEPSVRSAWGPPSQKALTAIWSEEAFRLVGGKGSVEYTEPFADFVLQAHVTTQAGTNSGIFFRSVPGEEMNGYEFQLNYETIGGDVNRPGDGGTGAIFRRADARQVIGSDGVPVTVTLVAVGPDLATWVEGVPVVVVTDTRAKASNPRQGYRADAGTIQLQGHDAKTDVTFHDVVIAPLATSENRP